MPSSQTQSGIPHNNSSTTLCAHGAEDDLSSSLTKVDITHNDSSNSLSSLATAYLSDDEGADRSRHSSSKSQSSFRRKPTPIQSVICFRRDFDSDEEDEDDSDFWDQIERCHSKYPENIASSALEDYGKDDKDETQEIKEGDILTNTHFEGNDELNYEFPISESFMNNSINREWVTAKVLAEKLAEYPHSKASLAVLSEQHEFQIKSIMDLVACNSRIFVLNDDTVHLRPQIFMCSNHLSLDGCQNESTCEGLHICPQYLKGKCKDEDCSLGHSWDAHHNMRILNEFCLQSLPSHLLQKVISDAIADPTTILLEVCEEYNQESCERKTCKKLHICKYYIAGLARCPRLFCTVNHSFKEPSVEKILESHGINIRESPKDVVNALHKVNPNLVDQLPFETIEEESQMPITIWSGYTCGDVEKPEICYGSIKGNCEYERSGCKRLHCERTFHWQAREVEGCWLNLTLSQVYWLEIAFCNPQQDSAMLPQLDYTYHALSIGELGSLLNQKQWKVNFEIRKEHFILTSGDDSLELRRLCCEDAGQDVPGREFLWYYQNLLGEFIEYGTVVPAGEAFDDLSEITSQCLENAYQNHMDGTTKIHFTTNKYTYHLDVDTMIQLNEIHQTKCQVRRRPKPHIMENQNQPTQRRPSV